MAMHRVQSSDKTQKGHELWGAIGCAWDLLDFTISCLGEVVYCSIAFGSFQENR